MKRKDTIMRGRGGGFGRGYGYRGYRRPMRPLFWRPFGLFWSPWLLGMGGFFLLLLLLGLLR
ncbi:MAG: hypothetical protein H6671_08540 [Anaerolineaceae bacterium]|nr:hypothetical protein [Anaerolineaceae bacterium]